MNVVAQGTEYADIYIVRKIQSNGEVAGLSRFAETALL